MSTELNIPRLVSTAEAAATIGVNPRTILRWTENEDISRYQIGGTVRVDLDEIFQIMKEGYGD